MDNSWVKLYRKIADNDIVRDPTALQIFIWILIHVNKKTGIYTTGRFLLSEQLDIKPSTVRDALYRLRDKYKVADIESDNKKSKISLLNWSKYQSLDKTTTQDDDNQTTTRRQPDDTKQEYKNKEYKNIYREELLKILSVWNITRNLVNRKGIKSFKAIEDNYAYWRNEYSFEDIQEAIKKTALDKTFLGVISIDTFFRQKNPNREKVDYIGKALSYTRKTTIDKSGMETYGYIKRN